MNQLAAALEPYVTAFLLTTPRLIVLFATIPFLSRTTLPGILQTGIIMSFALILQPMMLAAMPAESLSLWRILGLVIKEAAVGLLIGYTFVMIFHGVQAAGFFIDNQRGSSMASSVDPLLGGQSSPLGVLFIQAFLVYFFATGGFLAMLGTVYASYQVMPVLSFFPQLPADGAVFMAAQLDRMVRIAFILAAPVFAAMFVAELGVAFVSRFAPQLNVFFLAMPIKSGVAFLVLVLYARTLLQDLGRGMTPFDLLFRQLEGVMR